MAVQKRISHKMMQANGPKAEDFGLLRTKEDLNSMMNKMMECGFDKMRAVEVMKERKKGLTKPVKHTSANLRYCLLCVKEKQKQKLKTV